MTRNVSSYRLPTHTESQIDALAARLGMSKANVITLAVDRMYREETRTMQTPYAVDPANPTEADADAMTLAVYQAAYPDRVLPVVVNVETRNRTE